MTLRRTVVWSVLSFLAACDKGPVVPPGPAPEAHKCSAVRPPTEPDLMGWDAASRASLHALRTQGVVAVAYRAEGCNVELEVLPNCIGTTGKYGYAPYSAKDTKIAHNADELYAKLPIGAASLGGKVAGGRALRTDYTLVGMHALPVGGAYSPADLRGDCERATHVVSRVYVGGFAMESGERSQIEARASVFSAGAGGSRSSSNEHIASEGNASECEKASADGKENPLCAVPLRIGLLAVAGRAEGGCPSDAKWDGKACVSTKPAVAKVEPKPEAKPVPVEKDGMILVPAGSFEMGSDVDYPSEQPVHKVSVAAFWMDRTEVTVAAYEPCVHAGRCNDSPKTVGLTAEPCNWTKPERRDHPINCVTYEDAKTFCAFAKKRLPTEEEWEYAARGPEARRYPWGDARPERPWVCWDRGRELSCEVGSHPHDATPLGIVDLAGNVSEWTASPYSKSYRDPPDQRQRVRRGGRFFDSMGGDLRASQRGGDSLDKREWTVGFRCVRSQ